MRLKHWLFLIVIIFYFGMFVFKNTVTLDPDFGWHLQFGRLIVKTHTIPVDDTYSYTMPSYHFIDHEWGTDIGIANLYDKFGITPLNIIFAFLGILLLSFLIFEIDLQWVGLPLFLIAGTIFDFMGIRPQIITFMLLSLLMSIIWNKKLWQRWRWFIPALFLLWANLHGGFAAGIVALGWVVIGQSIESHIFDKKNMYVFIFSILATLCNPYGYHLWIEISKSVVDPNLRFAIQEWYPAIYFTNIAFWFYVVISFFLVIRYHRKFSITTLTMYLFFFLAGLSSMRNIPLFVIVSFYPTVQGITYLSKEASGYLYGKERFVRGYYFFFILCVCFFLPQIAIFTYGSIKYGNEGQSSYPSGAVSYLRNHLPRGQLFSSYDWGGYLIWQLPEKKVFIDGRMPSWRNPSAPSDESTYAFGDYEKLLQGKISFASVVEKYNIDAILVSSADLEEQHSSFLGINFNKAEFLKPFFSSNWSFYPIVTQVRKMGWTEVYRDKTAVVFEKKD